MPEYPRLEGDVRDFGPNFGSQGLYGGQRYEALSPSQMWIMDLFSRHPKIFQSIMDFYSKSPSQFSVGPQASEPVRMPSELTVPPQRLTDPTGDIPNRMPSYF